MISYLEIGLIKEERTCSYSMEHYYRVSVHCACIYYL